MSWFISSSGTSGNVGLCCFVSRNIIQHVKARYLKKTSGFFMYKFTNVPKWLREQSAKLLFAGSNPAIGSSK